MSNPCMATASGPLSWSHDLNGVDVGDQLLEEHPYFKTGEICTEAEMDAVSESQVGVRVSPDIEAPISVEHLFIAIGGAFPHQNLVARCDRRTTQFGGPGRGATLRRRGAG